MALPALLAPVASFAGKSLASLGIWKAGSGALSKIGPKVRGAVDDLTGWIGKNPGTAAKGGGLLGGIGLGGWSISSTLSSVGIEDGQLQLVVTAGLGLLGIAAVGQLLDVQIGGDS